MVIIEDSLLRMSVRSAALVPHHRLWTRARPWLGILQALGTASHILPQSICMSSSVIRTTGIAENLTQNFISPVCPSVYSHYALGRSRVPNLYCYSYSCPVFSLILVSSFGRFGIVCVSLKRHFCLGNQAVLGYWTENLATFWWVVFLVGTLWSS